MTNTERARETPEHIAFRSEIENVIRKHEDGDRHDVGAYDSDCPTCCLLEDLRDLVSRDYDRYDQPSITEALGEGQWRPIETVNPQEGLRADLWGYCEGWAPHEAERLADCVFSSGKWFAYDSIGERIEVEHASHWMPLPSAPTPGKGDR